VSKQGRVRCSAIAIAALAVCAVAFSAAADPGSVTLVLNGSHPVDQEFHQGTFTAQPPFCPSGIWIGNGSGTRTFTCDDGTGTFTASFDGNLEHTQGRSGPWSIVAGTGKFVTLRGFGTGHVDSSTGTTQPDVVFRDTWTGIADFDATPPTGSLALKLTRPKTPAGKWKATVTLTASDNIAGNHVSYDATATAGNFSTERKGTMTAGSVSFGFAFHRARRVHTLQIQVDLQDPLANASRIRKAVKLR
jgi:hypothetical protein